MLMVKLMMTVVMTVQDTWIFTKLIVNMMSGLVNNALMVKLMMTVVMTVQDTWIFTKLIVSMMSGLVNNVLMVKLIMTMVMTVQDTWIFTANWTRQWQSSWARRMPSRCQWGLPPTP